MANLRNHGRSLLDIELFDNNLINVDDTNKILSIFTDALNTESASCKCSKSDLKIKKSASPYLENAISKIEERRGDLANKEHFLREKVMTMERSIPALMAVNMLSSGKKCDDAPMCKLKEIMSKMSSQPDPTERLLDSLKNTVESLNAETAELHEKIIAADIKLEESDMELESLELANREFDERLKSLEQQTKLKDSPSLRSIHSEDLFCLSRIRQLGQEEVNLKHSIRELEERETIFQEQMNRILRSREFRKTMTENQANEKKNCGCPMHIQTQSAGRMIENQANEKKNCPCPMHIQTQSAERMIEKRANEKKNCPCPIHIQTQSAERMTENHANEKKNCPCPIHIQTQSAERMAENQENEKKNCPCPMHIQTQSAERMTDNQENEKKNCPCPINIETQSVEEMNKPKIQKEDELSQPITNDDEKDPSKEQDSITVESSSSEEAEEEHYESAKTSPRGSTDRENGGAEGNSKSCPCTIPKKISCYDKSSCPSKASTSDKMHSSRKNSPFGRAHDCENCVKNKKSIKLRCSSPKSCRSFMTTKSNVSKGQGCSGCCKNLSNPIKSSCKVTNHSLAIKSKCCKNKTSCWLAAIAKCPRTTTCEKCQGLIPCRERPKPRDTSRCRCSCKGKCAMGKSTVPCNCADWLDSPDGGGYKPIAESTGIDCQISTDEEYSECCDCGCNDSDFSDSCLF